MNYKVTENFLGYIYQFIFEYRLLAIIIWFIIIGFLIRKLSKKDIEFYKKDFFKKKITLFNLLIFWYCNKR